MAKPFGLEWGVTCDAVFVDDKDADNEDDVEAEEEDDDEELESIDILEREIDADNRTVDGASSGWMVGMSSSVANEGAGEAQGEDTGDG